MTNLGIHPVINTDFLEAKFTKKLNLWFNQDTNSKSSLALIDIEDYQANYIMLKNKYGKELIKVDFLKYF